MHPIQDAWNNRTLLSKPPTSPLSMRAHRSWIPTSLDARHATQCTGESVSRDCSCTRSARLSYAVLMVSILSQVVPSTNLSSINRLDDGRR